MKRFLALLAGALLMTSSAVRAAEPCAFDAAHLQFVGTAAEQARCLLRPVGIGGNVQPGGAISPLILNSVNMPAAVSKDVLAGYLARRPDPYEAMLQDRLNRPLSRTPSGVRARYFVIHDTSTPYYGDRAFPSRLDARPSVNDLHRYLGPKAVAHYFVNRSGEIAEGHDFEVAYRATKLENKVIGTASRGLFVHVELVQPRRRDPGNANPRNDRFAPEPGFSADQYEALALLYTVASVRAGRWLIPAYHAVLDQGLADGHDDPQQFDLDAFAAATGRLRATLNPAPSAPESTLAEPTNTVAVGATARWGIVPGARSEWTAAAYSATVKLAPNLWRAGFNPSDIKTYCPAYSKQTEMNRQLFWVGLMSSLALHESGYDPSQKYTENFNDAQGRPVVSRGLLQLSIESGNGYRCGLTNEQQLHDPAVNLACGARILNRLVVRDGAISARVNTNWKGAAAYWSPFRKPDKRADIAGWTSKQPYCVDPGQ